MKTLLTFTLLLTSLLPADDLPKATAAASTSQGIVYRVEGGQAPLFLCGSIHLMQKKDFPLPAAYETAFKTSQRLVMEVPPEEMDPAKMQPMLMKYALLKEGELAAHLQPATYKALKAWAQEKDVPLDGFAKFQPWLVAISITQQAYEEFGMKADQGIDMYFKGRLSTEKKTTVGLESIEEQFRLLSSFSPEIQEKMILQSINEAKEAQAELAKLLQSWRDGAADQLAQTMTESFAELPEVGKLLLQTRNTRWLPKIKAMLAEPTPTMILVGAGHLCGDGNLVTLLQKEGFVVTQILTTPAK